MYKRVQAMLIYYEMAGKKLQILYKSYTIFFTGFT